MLKQIESAEKIVEEILQKHPNARDNDKILICHVWLAQGWKTSWSSLVWIKDEGLTPESITRCRRKFQEAGKYLGEKRQKRMEEEEKVREWARGKRQGELPF